MKPIYRELTERDKTEVIMSEGADFVLAGGTTSNIWICDRCGERIEEAQQGVYCQACCTCYHNRRSDTCRKLHAREREHKKQVKRRDW